MTPFFPRFSSIHVIDANLLVVTGATDGIGREFAIQLARAGFNVLLAARNQAKLDAVVADIGSFLIHVGPFPPIFTCTYALHLLCIQRRSLAECRPRLS